jgi:uncharacterized protein YjbI with pentapeptide repeats
MSLLKSKLWEKPELRKILSECALVGANLDRMDLRNMIFDGINFTDTSLRGADMRGSSFRNCTFVKADLSQAAMSLADFTGSSFLSADISMACGRGIVFDGCNMAFAHLRHVIMKHCFFIDANLEYVDMAHGNFIGSGFNGAKLDHIRNADLATFQWFRPKGWGPLSYHEEPGYVAVNWSDTGTLSLQENAGHRRVDL